MILIRQLPSEDTSSIKSAKAMIKYFKTIGNKDSPNFPSPLQWGFYSILIVVALLLAVKKL
jgi:hypothetical protein